jgi:hypothetical protein
VRIGSTRDPLADVGLAPSAVVLNGALALDLATGERFHTHHHDAPVAVDVLRAFRAHDLDPCVYVDHPDIDVYITDTPSTSAGHLAALGSRAVVADLDEIVAPPGLSFGVFGPRLAAVASGQQVRVASPCRGRHLERQVGPHDHAPPDSRSGRVCSLLRPARDRPFVLAIGDEVNDIELLTHAALGLAMADGHPGAIARRPRGAPTDDGGWATVLDFV